MNPDKTSERINDGPADEQAALIQALKTQVRALQQRLDAAESHNGQLVERSQVLRHQLGEVERQLRQIHASRHWRWMMRYWTFRTFLRRPYPAFRQWLRQVIPHATRARLLALVRRSPRPAVPEPAPQPELTDPQLDDLRHLLRRLGLPGFGSEAGELAQATSGLSVRQQTDLRRILDFARSAEHPPPRLVTARALPTPPADRRRLRILFVCGEFPNRLTGGGGAVFDLIRAQSQDHDVFLCAWYQPAVDEAALAAVQPFCRKVQPVNVQAMESGQLNLLDDLLEGTPADIVHYYWPRALACYSAALGRHQLFTHVEAVSLRLVKDLQRATPFSPVWRKKFGELVTALKVELVDTAPLAARIALTRVDGEFLARLAPHRPCVVLGVPIDFAATALPERPPDGDAIVFVGNYLHYPNDDAALYFCREVLPLVRQACPSARLHLVGANPTRNVTALQDGHHIIVTGEVADVRPYIQQAAVCVAPLVSGAGLRTKINLYSALQRVCVATSLAAVELPYVHGQDVWVADDPAAFARHVVDMLQQPERAQAMGQAAYRNAREHYDLPVITQQFYRLYHALETSALEEASLPLADAHAA